MAAVVNRRRIGRLDDVADFTPGIAAFAQVLSVSDSDLDIRSQVRIAELRVLAPRYLQRFLAPLACFISFGDHSDAVGYPEHMSNAGSCKRCGIVDLERFFAFDRRAQDRRENHVGNLDINPELGGAIGF